MPPAYTSCASYATCGACANDTSYACHWCAGDRACHAVGSAYGCAVGASCYEEECVRTAPQPSAVQPPNFGEFVAFTLFLACLFCCAGFCAHTCRAFRDSTTTRRIARDERYISMSDFEEDGNGRRRSKRGPSLEDLAFIPTVEHIHVNPVAERISKVSRICCVVCTGLAFVFTIIALVLYPHAPTYTVCNSELDWSTVFSSLAHLTIGADYRVAISVNNGNRFGIVLDSLVAEFDFDEESVATIDFKETIELVPAAITDVVVPIKFAAASALQAATIYSAYRAGTLTFKANANIKGTAAGFYSFEMDIKDHIVDMSADMDLSLCSACHES